MPEPNKVVEAPAGPAAGAESGQGGGL